MRKHLLLSGAFLLFASMMMAEPVTQRQALQQAKQFFSSHGITVSSSAKIFRAPSKQATPTSAYYVFNAGDDKGFAIVSGDDRTVPILGYSLNGSFTDENMPENLKAWLAEYQRQIEYIQKNNITLDNSQSTATDRAKIPEMLTTKWNQDTPYNNTCPVFSDGNRSVTGCVATAMAQVLYYNWQQNPSKMPTQTLADMESYQTNYSNATNITVPAIGAGAPIDWSNMLPSYRYYNGTETDAQKNAVANLMLYCGTAVKMEYSSGTSSAYSNQVPGAFTKYFGMDPSTIIVGRSSGYTNKQWNDLIYNELANNRVVYYSGSSASNSGHAFVIDGYEGNSFFHVNWGWGGMDDGAYVLSVLAPSSGGTGAGIIDDGYNYDQQAVLNASPDNGGKSLKSFSFENLELAKDTLKFAVFNGGTDSINVQVGIASVENDGSLKIRMYSDAHYVWAPNYGWYYAYPLSQLKDGDYNIVFVAKDPSETEWQQIRPGMVLHITVRGGLVTMYTPEAKLRMTGDISTSANATAKLPCKIQCTIANDGDDDFGGALHLFASTTSDMGSAVGTTSFGAIAGGENTLSYTWTPTAAGTYTLWLCSDADGKNILGKVDNVVIAPSRDTYTNFSVSYISADNGIDDSQFIDSDHRLVTYVTGDSIDVTFALMPNGSQGTYDQLTMLYKYDEATKAYQLYKNLVYVYGYYGEQDFSDGYGRYLGFEIFSLDAGKYYADILLGSLSSSYTIDNPVYHNDVYAFIVGGSDPTGIESVRTSAQNDASAVVTVYNLQGMKVGTMPRDRISTLPHGLYIVNGKKIVVR